jgi:hypothetical protein
VNLRRGFLRFGIGLVVLWLVFWMCAYVISPYNTSLKPEPAFVILVTEWRVLAPCLVASVVLGAWIAAGFRSPFVWERCATIDPNLMDDSQLST